MIRQIHYWNSVLCRVPAGVGGGVFMGPRQAALPSAFYRALGKADFVERRTQQSPALGKELVYRVQDTRHTEALSKDSFAEW
jgi:hypothetical protein